MGVYKYFFIVLCLITTTVGRHNVRQESLDHETYSELNSIIEYYSRCYYRLPKKIKDIKSFLRKWEQQNHETFPDVYRGVAESLCNGVLMESFADSVFLYNSKVATGCVVYGHPLYWFMNKELYPSNRLDFSYQFQPCAYDRNGNYLFNWDSSDLCKQLLDIASFHDSEIVHYIIHVNKKRESIVFTNGIQDNHVATVLTPVIYDYLESHPQIYSVIIPL